MNKQELISINEFQEHVEKKILIRDEYIQLGYIYENFKTGKKYIFYFGGYWQKHDGKQMNY